jgi:lysozyme family protein
MDFNTAFDRLIGNEGGYVNNPSDPGGETNWGISKRSYPTVDILNLTRDGAKAIYLRDFWQAGQMDKINPAVAFQAFDFAVNSGMQTALRKLQAAVGVADDGNIGSVSLSAINVMEPAKVIMLYVAERLDFWRCLSTWDSFSVDWAGRAAADLRYGAGDIT